MEDPMFWQKLAAGQAARSTVEDCIREMVTDVELAGQLHERLLLDQELQRLKAALVERDYAAAETAALHQQQAAVGTQLADGLVKELWTLSQQMGELHEIKQNHQTLLVKYDEAIAKLMQAEDALEQAKEQQQQQQQQQQKEGNTGSSVQDASSVKAAKSEDSALTVASATSQGGDQKPAASEEAAASKGGAASSPANQGGASAGATVAKIPDAASTSKNDEGDSKPAASSTASKEAPPSETTPPSQQQPTPEQQPSTEGEAAAPVVSLEQDAEPEAPTLTSLDTKILMNVFGFLDALDILNTAQINISMYSRVDSLFGLGNGNDTADAGDNSTIATQETAPSQTSYPAATATTTTTTTAATTTTTTSSAAAATVTPSSSTTTTTAATPPPARPTATVAAIPPSSTTITTKPAPQQQPQQQQPLSSSPMSMIQHSRSGSNEGIRGIFNSMLQPRKQQQQQQQQQAAAAAAARTPVRTKRTGSSVSSTAEPAPMNAAMANSMAAKLTDQELNAIILMTERLRQKEQLAEKLLQERDALEAKLDGTESVKQFLVGKVRDMEHTLQAVEDNEAKVAQQIASDQEVIAFLDGRIRELEGTCQQQVKDAQQSAAELARIKEQAEQKGMVMGDMLQFERERWNESEREWKATRKVLVKEVKNCRAQIITLQAERDGYREQNEILRKAVLASPSSATSSSSAAARSHS